MGLMGLKINMSVGLCSFVEAIGEKPIPCFFKQATYILLFVAWFEPPSPKPEYFQISLSIAHIFMPPLTLWISTYEDSSE